MSRGVTRRLTLVNVWSRDMPNLSQWEDNVTSRYSPLAEIRHRGIHLSGDNARRLATMTRTKGILHETRRVSRLIHGLDQLPLHVPHSKKLSPREIALPPCIHIHHPFLVSLLTTPPDFRLPSRCRRK